MKQSSARSVVLDNGMRVRSADCSSNRVSVSDPGKLNEPKPAGFELCRDLILGEMVHEIRHKIIPDFRPWPTTNHAKTIRDCCGKSQVPVVLIPREEGKEKRSTGRHMGSQLLQKPYAPRALLHQHVTSPSHDHSVTHPDVLRAFIPWR